MMHLSWLSGFQNQGHGCTFLGLNQMLVNCCHRQKRRKCYMVFIHTAVRQNQNVSPLLESLIHFYKQMV